jgi:hypothetical protein
VPGHGLLSKEHCPTAAEQRLRVRLARPTDPIPIAAESLRFRRSPGEPERRFIPFRRFKTPLLTGLNLDEFVSRSRGSLQGL